MTLPSPLSPPDCSLRGYEYMPLFGARLFASEFYAIATDAEFRAAMHLWWSAWQQCPAGSVPKDDRQLALLSGFGRDLKSWAKVKDMAMRGFVECSDGRLYHPMLSEEAVRAFDLRLKADKKRDADRERLKKWREAQDVSKRASSDDGNDESGGNETRDETRFKTPTETPDETRDVAGRREGKGKEEVTPSLRSGPLAADDPDFAEFWAGYPRKVGKDAARSAYAKAKKRANAGEIMAGLRRQVWNSDPQFIPHPATWLNAGSWQDDPQAAAPRAEIGQIRSPPRESHASRLKRELGLDEAHDIEFCQQPPELLRLQ